MKTIRYLQISLIGTILLIQIPVFCQSLIDSTLIIVQTPCENVNAIINSQEISTRPDTSIRNNFTILRYLWQGPSSQQMQVATGATYNATRTGTYTLTVNALNRRDSTTRQFIDSVRVVFDAQCCKILLPNAFTPNGDNTNDVFAPVKPENCVFSEFQMQVFNRWGRKIFDSTNGDAAGWDGRADGKDAPSDVYVYWLRYTATGNGNTFEPEIFKGDVTLIR